MKNTNQNIIEFKEGDAWKEAYPVLSKIINEMNLKIGAEIGVAYGGHIEYILENTQIKKIYAVDPYKHFWWGYKDPMNFTQNKFNLIYESTQRRLKKFNNRVIFIREESQTAYSKINEQLDFVYIDANHTHNGVKKDIKLWFNKVKNGGIIAGHDYNHPNFPGVKKAVDEFFDQFGKRVNFHKSGVWWIEKKDINISFVIPAYNCEKTVRQSIVSVLNKNIYEGDEIVIVDDASTDATPAILKEFASRFPFIKIITHPKNMGGGAARNTAVKNAKHDLIFCLDSDNLLAPESVKKLKKLMIEKKAEAAAFETINFFKKFPLFPSHRWNFIQKISFKDALAGNINPASSGNYLFTKKSWKKAGGYPENRGALDAWGFGIRQLATGTDIFTLKGTYYHHRYGWDSYWVRYSTACAPSRDAAGILRPFNGQIEPSDIDYISNEPSWFDGKILSKRPLRLKNSPVGQDGAIEFSKIRKINWKIISVLGRPIKFIKRILYRIQYIKDFFIFRKMKDGRFNVLWSDRYPCLRDKTTMTNFDTHYIYHQAWAARVLASTKPKKHIDISSTLNFCVTVSAFIPVDFYDYRPAHLVNLSNLKSKRGDLTALPFEDNSVESISCMHTIEHIGLGRYGDPLDSNGDLKAIHELKRVTAQGGNLLFVVPIGQPKLMFNAHRIYSYDQIVSYFDDFELRQFALIPDNAATNGIIIEATKAQADKQSYGCGCFWFKKK